jgi:hypothetical protein
MRELMEGKAERRERWEDRDGRITCMTNRIVRVGGEAGEAGAGEGR